MLSFDGRNQGIRNIEAYSSNIIKFEMDDYDEYKLKCDIDSVVCKTNFDYTAYFKDFDYGNDKRNEDFDDFKYKSYSYIKEDVTNPMIIAYMMNVGINVIPKENSVADKTLKMYKNIARNIFNDSMGDYEKIVACNKYFSNYMVLDYDENAAYNKNGSAYFSNLLEEVITYGTINCGSAFNLPFMIYNLEGIHMYIQKVPSHVYGVIKMDDKWYISHHMLLYWYYRDKDYFNPLRGYLDIKHITLSKVEEDPNAEVYYKISYAYPGITLEKYHY